MQAVLHSSITTIFLIDCRFTVDHCIAENKWTIDAGIVTANFRLQTATQLNWFIVAIDTVNYTVALGAAHKAILSVIAAEADQIRR